MKCNGLIHYHQSYIQLISITVQKTTAYHSDLEVHSLLVSLFHTPEVKQTTYMSSVVLSSSLQFKEHLSPMPPRHEEDKFPNGISGGHFIAEKWDIP